MQNIFFKNPAMRKKLLQSGAFWCIIYQLENESRPAPRGVADRKGSIEVGKDADIVILDKEFNVKKTIIGGVVRYEA